MRREINAIYFDGGNFRGHFSCMTIKRGIHRTNMGAESAYCPFNINRIYVPAPLSPSVARRPRKAARDDTRRPCFINTQFISVRRIKFYLSETRELNTILFILIYFYFGMVQLECNFNLFNTYG
jgi:hypothetical protein